VKRRSGPLVAATIVLCSCTADGGAADHDTRPTPTSTYSGALTAWFLDPGSAPGRAAIETATESFQAEHPAVTVNVEFIPPEELPDRLAAAITSDQALDLAQTNTAGTAELAAAGMLAPATPADGVEYVDALLESGAIDGTSYGYPYYGDTQALVYRTDVLSRAGVSAPATWEEIFSVGDTLAAETPEIAPLHVAGAHMDQQLPLVWAAGGEIATNETGGWRSDVDSAAGQAAFSHFESVWKKG
jgi:N,N'-diacetylchitobiose transport system substrate-binding protein